MSPQTTPLRDDAPAARLVASTLRACDVAKSAAMLTARELAGGSPDFLQKIQTAEEELDRLDREINESVTSVINHVSDQQTRELLACLKFIIELERIGDLLLSVANRSAIVAEMLSKIEEAFTRREVQNALHVLKADSELDRLRNLIFVRHIENHGNEAFSESFHVVFIAQALERCGDHAKNMAEEICHLVSGCSVRHIIRKFDKPDEEVYLDNLRRMVAQRR